MNSFLNRVLAPGLRRVGPRFEPAAVAPVEAEPLLEEIAEERVVAPTDSRSSQEEVVRSPKEDRSLPHPDAPEAHPSIAPIDEPERPSRQVDSFFEKKLSSVSAPPTIPPSDRPHPGETSPAGEKPKASAEILSFEAVAFDPTVPPALRRFQPPGEERRESAASVLPKSDRPDRSAREIVWEVVSAEPSPQGARPLSPRSGETLAQTPRKRPAEGRPAGPPPSGPTAPPSSNDLPSRPAAREEDRRSALPKFAAPVPPPGVRIPPPRVERKEEKGDLIIEQMEVRVVAEPERRPAPPKARPAAPKRGGAWETAARYYLGKV